MRYTYRTYFYLEEDTANCTAEIPALSLNIPIQSEGLTRAQIEAKARDELATTLYILEMDGEKLPQDHSLDEDMPGFDWCTDLTVDTSEAKGRIVSVKRIDIS